MLRMPIRRWDAARLYLVTTGAAALCFSMIFTASVVYQVQTVGLNPLQLVLVGTTLEVTLFLFEVPTGVVADVISRRLSVIIGYILIGLGFLVEGLFPTFGAVLAAQLLWGIGYTFTSGAHQAWLTDEVGESEVGRIFLRSSQVGSLAGIAGTLAAMGLGSFQINLPIVLGGALLILLALGLAAVMPETRFRPRPRGEDSRWAHLTGTLRAGVGLVRARPALLAILGIGLFFGLYSEGLDRLGTKHLLESFTLPAFGGVQPVAWIGGLSIVGGVLSTAAVQVVMKRLDTTSGRALARWSAAFTGLLTSAVLGFALAGSFAAAVVIRWAISVLRTVIEPLQMAWINQHLDSSVRATVISMAGQVDAFGQMAGGPPVGLVGDAFGVRAALLASGLMLSPALALYAHTLRRSQPVAELPVD